MFSGFCIRLGNFFNSEIVGLPSNASWAVIFERIDSIPRHPAQLYESAAYLVGFAFMCLLYMKNKEKTPQGKILGFGLIWTFTARFLLEFFKENQVAFEQGMLLNMGQLLSIPYILLGVLLFTGVLQSALGIPKLPKENS
jgi:prolipoprotein diacylglyceryltransferase